METLPYPFPKQSLIFTALIKQDFENIVGKGENAGYRHFLHFSTMFSTLPKIISILLIHLFCHLQIL